MIQPLPPAAPHPACENKSPPPSQPAAVQDDAALPADPSSDPSSEPLAVRTPLDAQRDPPQVFDHRARFQYCHLLRQGFTKGAAARLLGVSPRTIQLAVKDDPDLADRVRQARLDCHATAAAQVARAGEKNWRAAAWLLERGLRRRCRRALSRPRQPPLPLSDPLARAQVKDVVRNVLLEVMPELRNQITAQRNKSSPLAEIAHAAATSANAFTADRNARFAALAAEVKAIRDAGQSPDVHALWRKHLPGVPLPTAPSPSASPNLAHNSAHPNAQSSPALTSPSAVQNAATQPFATTAPLAAEPLIALNP